jgi:hypothetical protein
VTTTADVVRVEPSPSVTVAPLSSWVTDVTRVFVRISIPASAAIAAIRPRVPPTTL